MDSIFFCQAEDGIRYLVRSRGLGDVYKRQGVYFPVFMYCLVAETTTIASSTRRPSERIRENNERKFRVIPVICMTPNVKKNTNGIARACLLYTSDAADERSSVDLGGRRIIKKKKKKVWLGGAS